MGLGARGTQQCDFPFTTAVPDGTCPPFRPRDDLICPTAQSQGRISSKVPGIRFLVPTPSYFPPLGFNLIQMWNSASDTCARVRVHAHTHTHTYSHTFSFSHSSSSQAHVCGPALLKPWACGDLHCKNTAVLNLVQITLLLFFLIFLTFLPPLSSPPSFLAPAVYWVQPKVVQSPLHSPFPTQAHRLSSASKGLLNYCSKHT